MRYMGILSSYHIPKAIFYLLKGDYRLYSLGFSLGFRVVGLRFRLARQA